MTATTSDIKYIQHQLEKAGFDSADLDDLVHDQASCLAAEANNEGMHEQIAFLLKHGYTPKSLGDALDYKGF